MRVLFTIGLFLAFASGCSIPKTKQAHREFSLGTDGRLIADFDSEERVHELWLYSSDQSLKLKVRITYAGRDIQRLLVLDPGGQVVWESTFTGSSESGAGRSSGVPSPGWEIHTDGNSSGLPGNIHDTKSWFCGDDLLYRVHRTWPDDRRKVHYEVTGPSGVLLFTKTYLER